MVSLPGIEAPACDPGAIWERLGRIPDPEIPVISIVDLGIVRDVAWRHDTLVVTVTPTYSGCPATKVIAADIARALVDAGIVKYSVETQLAPPWTTDWIAPGARKRLADYGIAPPNARAQASSVVVQVGRLRRGNSGRHVDASETVHCPRCDSAHTREQSRYGSTPCKAQYRCDDCLEPFDYFKPH